MWRQEDREFKSSPGKISKTLSQKQSKSKSMAPVIEYWPSMSEILGLFPNKGGKKKKSLM
jgi:hypothetical protein